MFCSTQLINIDQHHFWGLVLKKPKIEWIPILIPKQTKRIINIDIDYSKKDLSKFIFKYEFDGYLAVEARNILILDENIFINHYLGINISDLILDSIQIENKDDIYQPLLYKLFFHKDENELFNNKITYLELFSVKHYEKNPFLNENRKTTIDFGYSFMDAISTTIFLPENYQIDEKIENTKFNLIENNGSYNFRASITEGGLEQHYQIETLSILNIDRMLYDVSEYKELQNFFSKIIKKNNEFVTLRSKI